eukprot:scaffold9322_cov120-Isochrysis_galbana.AAC.3
MQWLVSSGSGPTVARTPPHLAISASSSALKPSWSPKTKTAFTMLPCTRSYPRNVSVRPDAPSSCTWTRGLGGVGPPRSSARNKSSRRAARPPAWKVQPSSEWARLAAPCATANVRLIAAATERSSGCRPRTAAPSRQTVTLWFCKASHTLVSRRTPWLRKMADETQRASKSTRPAGRLSSLNRPRNTQSGVPWQQIIRSRRPVGAASRPARFAVCGTVRSKPSEASRVVACVLRDHAIGG